ncbi:MAG: UDP-N-acetylmuramoyl-L-alanine--D-glutamate ligase [Candidatus Marinimicrobia bacterium]|nr:UDP-N-acetylmuramoyl-L-alanine--D-glutamate ligase [Candidatus Neomarinimicrobiota bacterium]
MDISNRNTIDLKDKKIVVIGLGLSGYAAAKLAIHCGAHVLISDPSQSDIVKSRGEELSEIGISVELGSYTDNIYDADLWILSPGVPKNEPIVTHALVKKITIVGEIEFASWFTESPIIAVTGSNGKTTTVNILTAMCQTDSTHGVLAGNVGSAFSKNVLDEIENPDPNQVYILEISSFQMEFIQHFHPNISVFLNITPDHLDRHGSMADYTSSKMNMCQNQGKSDTIIYNGDDPILTERLNNVSSQIKIFGFNENSEYSFRINAANIYDKSKNIYIKIDEIALPGPHNVANLTAAAMAAKTIGIPDDQIQHVFRSFQAIQHRLENVATISGIDFINDSKATNVDAVKVALQSYTQPIILILGGKDKGGDFTQLLPHTHNVKAVLAYGQARDIIATALEDAVRLSLVEGLKDAVRLSHQLASSGDIVLLSPGCASFDQFTSYEERGDMFKKWANELEQIA